MVFSVGVGKAEPSLIHLLGEGELAKTDKATGCRAVTGQSSAPPGTNPSPSVPQVLPPERLSGQWFGWTLWHLQGRQTSAHLCWEKRVALHSTPQGYWPSCNGGTRKLITECGNVSTRKAANVSPSSRSLLVCLALMTKLSFQLRLSVYHL